MRDRFLRLLDSDATVPGVASQVVPTEVCALFADLTELSIPRDIELGQRDWAIFLLHTAAEIEHALLVQYLYAAYSIKSGVVAPGGENTDDWISAILKIAQEEMGHLITLQNVLCTLGGPLNFERQDFPYRSKLYPFRFTLERFSKDSLAKYVAAEMPAVVDSTVLSTADRDEIWLRAKGAAGGDSVNHVGELYKALLAAVASLPEGDFRTDRGLFQATAAEWFSNDSDDTEGVKVISMTSQDSRVNRDEALRALRIIAFQGEGVSSSSIDGSHFNRFLEIYRAFPNNGFEPSLKVPKNPYIPGDANGDDPIENPTTQLWARLFNVRYRILLTELAHVLEIPRELNGSGTPRQQLVQWVFNEMADSPASLRELAKKLTTLDRRDSGDAKAGAPFGLPYTMAIPSRGPERWRLHLDLIDASVEIIRDIEDPPVDPILRSIYDFELGASGRRDKVLALLGSDL